MFEKIKRYYDENLWSKARVRNMVAKRIITKEEYADITGEDYEQEEGHPMPTV